MNIPEFIQKSKARAARSGFQRKVAILGYFLLVVALIFGLRKLFIMEKSKQSIAVGQNADSEAVSGFAAGSLASSSSFSGSLPLAGGYVGSKTGQKYYLPWCGEVLKLTASKKIWFASRSSAVSAGYEPAKGCH